MALFSRDQLQKLITETLPADAQPGEKVIVGTVDSTGAKVVAAFKLKEHWELQAAAEHDWHGDTKAGAKVLLRF